MYSKTKKINKEADAILKNKRSSSESYKNLFENRAYLYEDNLFKLFDDSLIHYELKKILAKENPELILRSEKFSPNFKEKLTSILKGNAWIKALDIISLFVSFIWLFIGLIVFSYLKEGKIFLYLYLLLFIPLFLAVPLSKYYRKKDQTKIDELLGKNM